MKDADHHVRRPADPGRSPAGPRHPILPTSFAQERIPEDGGGPLTGHEAPRRTSDPLVGPVVDEKHPERRAIRKDYK